MLNTFNLDVALAAAESEGLITILSAPKVATLNNQRAEIQSGLRDPHPDDPQQHRHRAVHQRHAAARRRAVRDGRGDGARWTSTSRSASRSSPSWCPGATNAPISTKDARTRLIVRDGGTAVIGGIYKVTGQSGEDRVPGLSNIPLIGHLFKHKTRDRGER